MGKDEDDTERELNQLGRAAGSIYCQKPYIDAKGKKRRCGKKRGHWGKCR